MPYGFESNEAGQVEVTGGTAYVVFPITVERFRTNRKPIISYMLGNITARDMLPQWRTFERNIEAGGTWYAIERESRADGSLVGLPD